MEQTMSVKPQLTSEAAMSQQAQTNATAQQEMCSGQMSAITQMINQQLVAKQGSLPQQMENQQALPQQIGNQQGVPAQQMGNGLEENFATSAQTQQISQAVLHQQIQAQAAYQAQLAQL